MARKVFKTVLFLVESSQGALEAARTTVQLAKTCDAKLVAVAVVDTETLKQLVSNRILAEREMHDLERDLESSFRKQLAYITDLAKGEGVKVDSLLLKGACHMAVMRAQRETGADLIVLAPFSLSKARRDLVANEKHLIADQAECPVLILR